MNDTQIYSYWESHQFENALCDEGEYIKVEDVYSALEKLANVERRVVLQNWFETETTKTGWDSEGWYFKDDGMFVGQLSDWEVVEHISLDKFGNPIVGIVERPLV